MTFSHLSGNLWIPSQKNCAGLAAKNEWSQFLIPCSDVNRIPVRALCIQKSQGATSGLYGGCQSCTILCFAKNCCTRFDEGAGALSWWRSQWPEMRSFSSHGITQSFQNFNVIFFVDRLTSWSKFVVHNTLTIEKDNQHWLDRAPTLTCFLTTCTTPLSVLCPYFRPQRPSVSFQSSLYNSCRDWSKPWCKFVDLFFLSFSTVNKCDERKKHSFF